MLGIDVGGTFTDFCALGSGNTPALLLKVPTTGDEPELGVAAGLEQYLAHGLRVRALHHGTTIVTNALVQSRLPHTVLLCTAGFRDVLEMRRLWREKLFGYDWVPPDPLIPRCDRIEIKERVGPSGEVLVPLDEVEVRKVARQLRDTDVGAVAVAFLFSVRNPIHERRTAEILQEELPGMPVSVSVDVLPELHEFERTSTTVINAMACPTVDGYLDRLQRTLVRLGVGDALGLVRSDGGLMSSAHARQWPAKLVNSGPAAGVTAAALLAREEGWSNAITLDMGGTSTDVGLIWDGHPLLTDEANVRWNTPVRGPQIEVRSIGAGGGSIVGFDSRGIWVGPESVGADPGPACYLRGGTLPTVTDALLVLGALPRVLAGGQVSLSLGASKTALRRALPEFTSAEDAADAVYMVALHKAVVLIREMTVSRGYDPRLCILTCYGGLGGVFAADLARELEIRRVCIPPGGSVLSAVGAALGRPTAEVSLPLDGAFDTNELGRYARALKSVLVMLKSEADHVGLDPVAVNVELNLKYRSQEHGLGVPLRLDLAEDAMWIDCVDRFHRDHERLFRLNRSGQQVDLVSLRGRALGRQRAGAGSMQDAVALQIPAEPPGQRRRTWLWKGKRLPGVRVVAPSEVPGSGIEGPLFVEDAYTTVAVPPGDRILRGSSGAMILEIDW